MTHSTNSKIQPSINYYRLEQKFPKDWNKYAKIILFSADDLSETKSLIFVGSEDHIYLLDLHLINLDSFLIEYKGDIIGTIHKKDSKISGIINLHLINKKFGSFIIVPLSSVPFGFYLLKPEKKNKFKPKAAKFLTVKEYIDSFKIK